MSSEKLAKYISDMRTDLAIKQSKKSELEKKQVGIELNIKNLNIDVLEETVIVLKKLSKTQRDSAKLRLEELATEALQYSMNDTRRVEIRINDTLKRQQAYVWLVDDVTGHETDPYEDNGGGVIDILGIGLLIISLQSAEPPIDGPVLIDEPFKMVSEEFIPALANFIRKISDDFGRQIIVVTHNKYLANTFDTKIDFNLI